MITVNYLQLAIAEETLAKFVSAALPIDVAFAMKTLLKKYNPALVSFKEKRFELFKELGIYDAETDSYNIPEENQEEFGKRFNDIGTMKIELDCDPVKTKISWLPKNLLMTPEELSVLEPFLVLEND